jgi:hypothetical protein
VGAVRNALLAVFNGFALRDQAPDAPSIAVKASGQVIVGAVRPEALTAHGFPRIPAPIGNTSSP